MAELKQSSLSAWVKRDSLPCPKRPWLPDPNVEGNVEAGRDIAVANASVESTLDKEAEEPSKKRGKYHVYDSKIRAQTGRAAVDGLASATRQAEKLLGHPVTNSTVRSIRKSWRRERSRCAQKDPGTIVQLPPLPRGRPLLVGASSLTSR